MKEMKKTNIIILIVILFVTALILTGYALFRPLLSSYSDLPTALRSLTTNGEILNFIAGSRVSVLPNPVTNGGASSNYSYGTVSKTNKVPRIMCDDFFKQAFLNQGGNPDTSAYPVYINVNSVESGGNSKSPEELKDLYYYISPLNEQVNAFEVMSNSWTNDPEIQNKNILTFIQGNCKYDIDLKKLDVKDNSLLDYVYYDSKTDSVYFVATEGAGLFYAGGDSGDLDVKPELKSYLFDVKKKTAIVKTIPFQDGILNPKDGSGFYYFVKQDGSVNPIKRTSYFTVNYGSVYDGCGLSCTSDPMTILKDVNLKSVDSRIGVYEYHYDTGQLVKVLSTVFYNPSDHSIFTGGGIELESEEGIFFTERRELMRRLGQ